MADTGDFRNGFTMTIEGTIFTIAEFQHVKPGKGGAFVRTKLRNVQTGAVTDRTFRSGDKVEEIRLEKREMQFLYADGELFHLMDQQTYEQLEVTSSIIGDVAGLMKENETVFILMADEKPLSAELANFVELAIAHTEPGLKGDTATGAVKPATLETGAVVMVPLFVNQDDVLKIDTRSGEYVERA